MHSYFDISEDFFEFKARDVKGPQWQGMQRDLLIYYQKIIGAMLDDDA